MKLSACISVLTTSLIMATWGGVNEMATDMSLISQLKASDKVEEQEKNVVKLLKWWFMESPKAFTVKDFSIELDKDNNKKIILNYTKVADMKRLEQMQAFAKKVLRENGYKKLEEWRGSNPKSCVYYLKDCIENYTYQGSLIEFRKFDKKYSREKEYPPFEPDMRHRKYEIDFSFYHNPNVKLFDNPYGERNHPQNIRDIRFKAQFSIRFIDNENKKVDINIGDAEEIFFSENAKNCECGSSREAKCFSVPAFYAYFNDQYKCTHSSHSVSFDLNDEIKKYSRVEFLLTYNKNELVLGKFKMDCASLFSQSSSTQKQSEDVAKLFLELYRESFKNLTPSATYYYDHQRRTPAIKLKITCDEDARVNQCRSFMKKIRRMNLDISGDKLSYYDKNNNCFTFSFPDEDSKIYYLTEVAFRSALRKAIIKHTFMLKIQCKDKTGKVLQDYSCDLAEHLGIRKYNNNYAPVRFESGWNKFEKEFMKPGYFMVREFGELSSTLSFQFKNPKDASNVHSVTCEIVEVVAD